MTTELIKIQNQNVVQQTIYLITLFLPNTEGAYCHIGRIEDHLDWDFTSVTAN